jgi:hypothetical protein
VVRFSVAAPTAVRVSDRSRFVRLRCPRATILDVRELREFFRANPQVLVLLVICLVLGIGTFIVVLFGIASSGPGRVTGEPSGAIQLARAIITTAPI